MKHTDILESINDILCLELLSNSHSIAVSPDGRQLAVAVQSYRRHQAKRISERFLPSGLNQQFEGSEIWLVTVKNGESRNLTPNWGTSYRPAWSPDGEKLAFYSDKHGKAQLWIWERGENEPRLASEVTIRPFSQRFTGNNRIPQIAVHLIHTRRRYASSDCRPVTAVDSEEDTAKPRSDYLLQTLRRCA